MENNMVVGKALAETAKGLDYEMKMSQNPSLSLVTRSKPLICIDCGWHSNICDIFCGNCGRCLLHSVSKCRKCRCQRLEWLDLAKYQGRKHIRCTRNVHCECFDCMALFKKQFPEH